MASLRVKDNFSEIPVPAGYKVKSRKGCGPTPLIKARGEAGHRPARLPGRAGTSPTENPTRPAKGHRVAGCILCLGAPGWEGGV